MGNPSLPHLFTPGGTAPEPTAPQHDPAARTGGKNWHVYILRGRGLKLGRDDVVKGVQRGILVILPDGDGGPRARLEHPSGFDLAALYRVSIRRMLPHGHILLHGVEVVQKSRRFEEYPQAWWCVPLSL